MNVSPGHSSVVFQPVPLHIPALWMFPRATMHDPLRALAHDSRGMCALKLLRHSGLIELLAPVLSQTHALVGSAFTSSMCALVLPLRACSQHTLTLESPQHVCSQLPRTRG